MRILNKEQGNLLYPCDYIFPSDETFTGTGKSKIIDMYINAKTFKGTIIEAKLNNKIIYRKEEKVW